MNNIDIACLSEIWLSGKDTKNFVSSVTPPGFFLHHKPRTGRTGGGVGFVVRDNIPCIVIKSPDYGSFEHIVLNCKFQHRSVNFVSVYRPPGSTSDFMGDFVNFLDFLFSLSSDPVLVGDFNIDHELLGSSNLVQHVNVMTHIHGSTLVHIVTT